MSMAEDASTIWSLTTNSTYYTTQTSTDARNPRTSRRPSLAPPVGHLVQNNRTARTELNAAPERLLRPDPNLPTSERKRQASEHEVEGGTATKSARSGHLAGDATTIDGNLRGEPVCGRIDPASPLPGHMDGNATMSAHQAHCSRASSWRMDDTSSATSIPFSQPSRAQANGGGHMPAPSIGGGKPPMRAQETHTGTARMSSQSARVDGAAVMAEHQMQYRKTPEAVEEMIADKPKRAWADQRKACREAWRKGWHFFLLHWFGFEDGECFGGIV